MPEEEKKTNQSWGGRFKKPLSDEAAAFGESQSFDRRLYREDIAGSKAHAAMLGRQGIIATEEAALIHAGLDKIQEEIEAGEFVWKPELEDVHMNIESRLVELIGPAGKKLHTGRSRNDQIGLDFRLHVAAQCENWKQLLRKLIETVVDLAGRNQNAIMPGFTHLQPAQPVFAAQHLLAYAGMFRRDWERIERALPAIRTSPLGAGALAGSTYPLDPQSVADEVGFHKIYANSMDAVSDRDFVLEALFIGSVIMMHISRLCEELVIWANPAFGFITLPDEFSTGSSIMPQKKNPDMAELARGKTGRTYGNLMALLTTMKGLPLAYNKDMQEDKEAFFDTADTVASTLKVIAAMLELLVFNPQRMKAACKAGFLNATDLADYLAGKNIPFRDAHHLTGLAVARAEELGIGLEELSISEFKKIAPQIGEDIYPLLDYEACAARRETPGGTGRKAVRKQLADWHDWLRGN